MYNVIPLILILISLCIIIIIVLRKFSALASLDVDNIQAEKEAKFKERIISNRLKRNISKWFAKIIKISKVLTQQLSIFSKLIYNKLLKLKDSYRNEAVISLGDKEKRINELYIEVDKLIKDDDLDSAEKILIEIIGLDSKNIKAFEELGQLYFKGKNYEEATQTFNHIIKLIESGDGSEEENRNNEKIAEIYFNLALIDYAIKKLNEALVNINKALVIEPNNPRYLDIGLEISIINKDKILAMDLYNKLKEANSDNNKLKEFKEQVDGL